MAGLPRTVALMEKDSRNYLGCMPNGHLKYWFDAMDGRAKFAVETATIGGGYVNIRSCRNNKYWVRSSASEYLIVAGAEKANEKQGSWNCTLFKPSYENYKGSKVVVFQHVQLGQKIGVSTNKPTNNELLLMPKAQVLARSVAADYRQYVKLPKYVAFQGDNGQYYQLHWQDGHPFLQAGTYDTGSSLVVQETFYNHHGNVRVKNVAHGKFWRGSPNWIWADSDDSSDDANHDTIFRPIKVDNSIVALRNLGNNKFVQRIPDRDWKFNCLNADSNNIIFEARLKVVEPVLTRSINVTEFRLDDARIYEQHPLVMGQNSARNPTNTSHTTTLGFKYSESKSSTWSNSITVNVGLKATFESGIPLIAGAGIEVSTGLSDQYQWGETKESSKAIETSYTATVPKHTEVVVKLVATKAKCDVPFTYNQVDTLTDGRRITTTFYDGMYTGVNAYNFHYVTTEKPI